MNTEAIAAEQGIEFGPFRLFPARRLLETDRDMVRIGGRALDILILLVERKGEVVAKQELITQAWPDMAVDEGSLRVQIATLRRSLGDGVDGQHYIVNVPGRGYCFVAATKRVAMRPAACAVGRLDHAPALPPQLARMVGRADAVRRISALLDTRRFVTIHGPGGIGKTTVALAVGHAHMSAFAGAVHFLDLGQIGEGNLLPSALASALGLSVQTSDPTPSVLSYLRARRAMLILDSCEHLIEPAAALAEKIVQGAPHVGILATSRESLQVEGEYVYRLPPLECPVDGAGQTAGQVLSFPAAQLLVERVAASGHSFDLTDGDAPVVASVCRKLDGNALAIELAATRVGTFGLRETAALLDDRLRLLWRGRRTALPRHQTLTATLSWSYDLLNEAERTVLCRVSTFVGPFTLEAACDVADRGFADRAGVAQTLGQLVNKSLVAREEGDGATLYRLLDATRSYAFEKLRERDEVDAVAGRHAQHYLTILDGNDAAFGWCRHLGNIRAALEWCLSGRHDEALGVALAAAAAQVFIEMCLFSECRDWVDRALSVVAAPARGTRRELHLQAALGLSLMLTKGHDERSRQALERGLELAQALQDHVYEFRILVRLHLYYRRSGELQCLIGIAEQAEAVAEKTNNQILTGATRSLLGVSYHLIGDQSRARPCFETALCQPQIAAATGVNDFELQFHGRARVALARALWLNGFPDRAARLAAEAADDPTSLRQPLTHCIALIWSASVWHWVGDLSREEDMVERLGAYAEQHGMPTFTVIGSALKGRTMIARGDLEEGIGVMREAVGQLRAKTYALYTMELDCVLAEALATSGRIEEALAMVEADIQSAERNSQSLCMPELFRVRGQLLHWTANDGEAERCFQHSLELARAQSALSWQLRTSIDIARLWSRQGRRDEAPEILRDTYLKFDEGFDTADLKEARAVLSALDVR